jgi:hypothetical protein
MVRRIRASSFINICTLKRKERLDKKRQHAPISLSVTIRKANVLKKYAQEFQWRERTEKNPEAVAGSSVLIYCWPLAIVEEKVLGRGAVVWVMGYWLLWHRSS